jgi:N-acetylglucosaminyldiphosphoundecaprenol N-acetyl-beta-D-mannosaminyltransferase
MHQLANSQAQRPTVQVINTPCVLTTRESLTVEIADFCKKKAAATPPLSVDYTNVHIVAMRSVDPAFAATTASVDWFVSDSQVLSWAISLRGGKNHARIYGPDFLDYFTKHGDTSLKHFFLGGSQDCLDKLIANLKQIQPDLIIAGSRNGYFKAEDNAVIVEQINAVQPDIVWVGLGTPKQQEWIHQHLHQIKAGALLAVGFAFDVNAGTKKDAPAFLGPLGLTWLYRLLCEPRRLWKRYLVYNSIFVWKLLLQILFQKQS